MHTCVCGGEYLEMIAQVVGLGLLHYYILEPEEQSINRLYFILLFAFVIRNLRLLALLSTNTLRHCR